MLSFKDIIYFQEVSSSLSLTRASERLGITQPSLSISMKRLEKSIGNDLFIRHKNGVYLTQAGKQLLQHSQELIGLWQQIKQKAFDSENKIEGKLTFGCHSSVALYHLPDSFSQLLTEHRKLDLNFMHDLSRNITEAVISLKCDIGLVVNPIQHPDLVIIKVKEDKVTLWHNFSAQELKEKEHTLLYDPALAQSNYILKQFKRPDMFTRFIESYNLELLAKLTYDKAGMAILPEGIVHSERGFPLTPLNGAPHFTDELCIIYRHENRFVKSIQAIVDSLR